MTYASLDEVELVARSGAALALRSTSISVVRGALPPAQEFAGFGGCVGLGTDQVCNCTNMFDEMKSVSYTHLDVYKRQAFKDTYTGLGGEIVAEATYQINDVEFRAQLTSLAQSLSLIHI